MTLLAWIIAPALLLAAYPYAALATSREDNATTRALLTACLTLAFGAGLLTLAMFWISLVGLPLNAATSTIAYLMVTVPAWVVWRRKSGYIPSLPKSLTTAQSVRLALLIVITLTVLFNAGFWTFSREDAIGIYHAQAEAIVEEARILPLTGADSLYLAYPPLMQLLYAYVYDLSGWSNEYLAKFMAALLAVACIPATYLLGRILANDDKRAGRIAVFTLVLAPTFVRWASAGYVDLPMAFYVTLSMIFAYRLWQNGWKNGGITNAIIAGAMFGFATWTKNAALTLTPFLGIWLLWAWRAKRIRFTEVIVAVVSVAAVALPWYLRNLIGAGFIIPSTAWIDQAQHTLANLFVLITKPEIYGLSGWLMLGASLISVYYSRRDPAIRLLLLWIVPYFAVWWVLTSYDPRFLLHILPLFAAITGIIGARLYDKLAPRYRHPLHALTWIIVLITSAYIVWISVEYKRELMQNPLMSHEEKYTLTRQR